MKCKACNKELEQAKGKKARIYCDDACRMAYKRHGSIDDSMQDMGLTKSEQTISEQVKRTANPNRFILTQEMLDEMPGPVVRPAAQPKSGRMPRVGWQSSPNYAMTIYNLLTLTISELQARCQFVPVWRYARGEDAMFDRPKTEQPTRKPANHALPGDDDYVGVCHKNEQGVMVC